MIDPKELQRMGLATRAIHASNEHSRRGTLTTPIYQTSTFVFDSAEQDDRRFVLEEDGHIYTRLGDPTCTAIGQKVTSLEDSEACVSASSGIGAITSTIYPLVQADDRIATGKTLYGCTYSFLERGLSYLGMEVTSVDARNLNEIKAAIRPNVKLVYIGTPTNPSVYLTDIEGAAKITHSQGGAALMVDSTYCTPFITRPLDLGVDVVVHSATKYLNSHGDMIAGFAVGREEYADQVRLFAVRDMMDSMPGPFEAYLIARGIKTLEIRMERHCTNAQHVVEFLERHPAVASIAYPGLKSFPQYGLAQKQTRLPGAVVTFRLRGGLEAGRKLINNLHLATLYVSLGDAKALIEHLASMTHSPYTPEKRTTSDIGEGTVRLLIGLENVKDIIADLKDDLDTLL